MPSIWCPKCETKKNRSNKCPECGFIEEQNNIKYKEKNTIQPNQQKTIIIILLFIISLSISYIAYSKYRENKMIDDSMEMMFGTTDIKEIQKKQTNMYDTMIKTTNDQLKEMQKKQKEMFKKLQN